ncbi:MAG: Rieske (2Fe-2S) protein [Reichenbachiella sp.]
MAKDLIFESKKQAETSVPLNGVIKINVDGIIICLTRTPFGYFAFEKTCPHMSDDLSKGNINNENEIVCSWHSFRFNLRTGEEVERRCKDLKRYSVVEENNQLFIHY